MLLLLVRHAIAEDAAPGGCDAERALTEHGRALFLRHSLPWLAEHAPLDRLLHSPWLRAAQTAELLQGLLAEGVRPEPCARLAQAPDAKALAACSGARVAAVGHQPWLVQLAALASFDARGTARAERIALRKGGALLLEGEPKPGAMRLLALFAPPRR